jgi:hypothetical protein
VAEYRGIHSVPWGHGDGRKMGYGLEAGERRQGDWEDGRPNGIGCGWSWGQNEGGKKRARRTGTLGKGPVGLGKAGEPARVVQAHLVHGVQQRLTHRRRLCMRVHHHYHGKMALASPRGRHSLPLSACTHALAIMWCGILGSRIGLPRRTGRPKDKKGGPANRAAASARLASFLLRLVRGVSGA